MTANQRDSEREMRSPRWGYFRIITGTIAGGILGFYVMHRVELKYKVSAFPNPCVNSVIIAHIFFIDFDFILLIIEGDLE